MTGLDGLFHRMFNNEIIEKFGITHTKILYSVCHGIGPAVLEELAADVQSSVGCYTIMLDETTTTEVKKQCDFLVRYSSE